MFVVCCLLLRACCSLFVFRVRCLLRVARVDICDCCGSFVLCVVVVACCLLFGCLIVYWLCRCVLTVDC